jgi:Protein of unknown function (DUF3180)
MRPTRWTTLVAIAVVATAVVWGLLSVWESIIGVVSLTLPWTAPIALGFVAAVLLGVAISLRNRFADEIQRARVNPFFAARAAMFARAGSRTGALIAGAYIGVALFYPPDLDVPARRDRVVVAAVSVLASLAVVAAGLYLERVCRLPEPPEDEPGLGLPA